MQRAKRNVENYYSVIGTWEETNITLTVLEHYIPRFFAGATEAYYSNLTFYIFLFTEEYMLHTIHMYIYICPWPELIEIIVRLHKYD